jgi:hypothetical protein
MKFAAENKDAYVGLIFHVFVTMENDWYKSYTQIDSVAYFMGTTHVKI